jgi:hypothetical protein
LPDGDKIQRKYTERGRHIPSVDALGIVEVIFFFDLFLQNAFFEASKLPDLLKWHVFVFTSKSSGCSGF